MLATYIPDELEIVVVPPSSCGNEATLPMSKANKAGIRIVNFIITLRIGQRVRRERLVVRVAWGKLVDPF